MNSWLSRSVLLGMVLSLAGSVSRAAEMKVTGLAFLAGRWTAETAQGFQEETWSPVQGDSVVGTFRVVSAGKAVFSEYWSVELKDGTPVLLIKHFGAGLVGWEAKEDATRLPMTELRENVVMFSDGKVTLRYERHGDVLVAVLTHVRAGKAQTERFELKRAG